MSDTTVQPFEDLEFDDNESSVPYNSLKISRPVEPVTSLPEPNKENISVTTRSVWPDSSNHREHNNDISKRSIGAETVEIPVVPSVPVLLANTNKVTPLIDAHRPHGGLIIPFHKRGASSPIPFIIVRRLYKSILLPLYKRKWLRVFLIWLCWITSGTVFYSIRGSLGWAHGFYMMVNVGYSIGWGYPIEKDYACMWYSVFNVLIGATLLSFALREFAESVVAQSKSWYEKALYESTMNDQSVPWYEKVWQYCLANKKKLQSIIVFVAWVCSMTFWACRTFDNWLIVDGLYFAVSSLSTGGLWAIPQDATDESYVIGKKNV